MFEIKDNRINFCSSNRIRTRTFHARKVFLFASRETPNIAAFKRSRVIFGERVEGEGRMSRVIKMLWIDEKFRKFDKNAGAFPFHVLVLRK